MIETILAQIASGTHTIRANCSKLNPENIQTMIPYLRKYPTVQKLELKSNYIGAQGLVHFSEWLIESPQLDELNLADNYLTCGEIEMYPNGNLKCYLTSQFEGLRKFCPSLTTLRSLDLSFNLLGTDGIQIIMENLSKNTTLEELKLNHMYIDYDCVQIIGTFLSTNTNLRELWLKHNRIGNGFRHIADALQTNRTLQVLKLNCNSIGRPIGRISRDGSIVPAIQSLADALRINTGLESLDLTDNYIDECGAIEIARALRHNSSLRKLAFAENTIGDEGAKEFANTLRYNSTLFYLDMFNTEIDDEGGQALIDVVLRNNTIRYLNLSGNDLSNALITTCAYRVHTNQNRYRRVMKLMLCKWFDDKNSIFQMDWMILLHILYPMLFND